MNQPLAILVLLMLTGLARDALADPIADAIQHPDRFESDRSRDSIRKPSEILRFFGARRGMRILEINSGSGYYAEILAHLVGEDGEVIAHNDPIFYGFVEDDLMRRYGYGRLDNVRMLTATEEELRLSADSLDMVLMALVYHDFYFRPRGIDRQIDVAMLLKRLHTSMKSKAVLAIIDHRAEAGAPPATGDTLHRIDPAIVRSQVEAAGFELVATSDILAVDDDDLTKSIGGRRGRTNRFVYKFIKP